MTKTHEWDADLELDASQARAWIASTFPTLAARDVVPLQSGWDNHVFLLDDTWIFRFPRWEMAVQLIAWERDHLPALASRLPLPVPEPAWIGEPSEALPRP
jgi:aminoglycoside phosphotransferase (APT) family kinase protein